METYRSWIQVSAILGIAGTGVAGQHPDQIHIQPNQDQKLFPSKLYPYSNLTHLFLQIKENSLGTGACTALLYQLDLNGHIGQCRKIFFVAQKTTGIRHLDSATYKQA